MSIAASVSVSVPIWLTLIRIELATPKSIPRLSRSVLVTNRSSPTSWTRSPIRSVRARQPFQVHFLSLLLEERAAGSLAEVAEHIRQKLIRRHPHVFGEVEARTAGEVLRNWDQIKAGEPGREAGIFGEVPENLPGPLYARKVQRRAATSGFDFEHVPYEAVEAELEELRAAGDRDAAFHEIGDVLFAAVNVARKLKVDPELALRAAADRFRDRVQGAADLAAGDGADWQDLEPEDQLAYYARARRNQEPS